MLTDDRSDTDKNSLKASSETIHNAEILRLRLEVNTFLGNAISVHLKLVLSDNT